MATPDTISYNAAISACEKGGQWQRVLALLKTMCEERVWPNTTSYSAAISACEKGKHWELGLHLLEECKIWYPPSSAPSATVHTSLADFAKSCH